jgi:hypothetical protein
MPQAGKDVMCWKKLTARAKVPFVVYADLEAITSKIHGCAPNPENSFTQNLEKHIPCGACAVLLNSDGEIEDQFLHRGEECIEKLFDRLRKWAKHVHEKKRKCLKYSKRPGDDKLLESATHCWICKDELGSSRVFEHDHVTGFLRGIAHKDCNSALKTVRNLPVFFHNGAGYDFKHLLKQYKATGDEIIECIPSTVETYTSFKVRVPTGNFTADDGRLVTIYEDLMFLDSFKF